MKILDVYERILRDVIPEDASLEDVLLYMVVLHTHAVGVRPDVPVDDVSRASAEVGVVLGPLTRNHLAELVSSLWPPNDRRRDMTFWHDAYARRTPYEVFEDVPEHLRDRAVASKQTIENHPLVERLVEE